jgi:hypothetical protein
MFLFCYRFVLKTKMIYFNNHLILFKLFCLNYVLFTLCFVYTLCKQKPIFCLTLVKQSSYQVLTKLRLGSTKLIVALNNVKISDLLKNICELLIHHSS